MCHDKKELRNHFINKTTRNIHFPTNDWKKSTSRGGSFKRQKFFFGWKCEKTDFVAKHTDTFLYQLSEWVSFSKRNFKLEVDKYPAMIDETFYQDQLKIWQKNALMLDIFKISLMCLLININIILMEAHLIKIKKIFQFTDWDFNCKKNSNPIE